MGAFAMTERAIRRLVNAILGESSPGGDSGFQSLVVSLTQSGTDDCVPNILKNDLGSLEYDEGTGGTYWYVLTDIDFDAAKIWIGGYGGGNSTGAILIPMGSSDANHGWYVLYAYNDSGKLLIEVDFLNNTFAPTTLSSLMSTNVFYMPEIRVYE